MKKLLYLLFALNLIIGCASPNEDPPVQNWDDKIVSGSIPDSLSHGKSYLSVYSQIYSFSQHSKYNLTGLISMRNVSEVDTLYISRADYFATGGEKIRGYIEEPVFLLPMETIDIIIDQNDVSGGTGSNFIFEWHISEDAPEPIFEGVMSSMQGNQGVGFTTTAKRLN